MNLAANELTLLQINFLFFISFFISPHHCLLGVTFQLHGESTSCLSCVTAGDAQVTKAQCCPIIILLSVNSVLR